MKRILYSLVGAVLALTVGFAGAYFTARVEVADSMIRGGTVQISAEPTSAALSIESLAPGTTATKPLTVRNDGNLPVNVVVTAAKKAGITDFYDALTCRVTSDGALLYEGPMSTLKSVPLGLPVGGSAPLQFAVSLPETAGNDLAADYAKVSVYIDAEQAH
jgi:hypothetical protein